MSVQLLDPTLDVVFKLLLLRDQSLLRDMIEAVLGLQVPIAELEVQNPEIPNDAPGDKSIVLDIRVRLGDGHVIDLEMQSTTPAGTAERFLYYWARNFVDSFLNFPSSSWRRLTGRLSLSDGLASYEPPPPRNSKS